MAQPVVISYSELASMRCPLQHQLSYIERWTHIPDPMSPLGKGTAWHLAMETHYKEIKHRQDRDLRGEQSTLAAASAAVERAIEEQVEPGSSDLADLVWWMYRGYTAKWGADAQWRVLAVEHAAQCRLPTPSGRPSGFILKMKIDLIAQDLTTRGNQIWIIDHKSCRNLPKGKELELDDQFGLYTWGLRSMRKKVFGQIHNAARTERLVAESKVWGTSEYVTGEVQALPDRFVRTPTYRTDIELDTIAVEAYLTARARYDQQRQLTKQGVDSPRRTDPSTCRFLCNYLDPCLAGRKGVNMREYLHDRGFRRDPTRN